MESAELVQAVPAGCLFNDWINRRNCAKSTAYRMRSELGIVCEKRRRGGAVEVWLSADDEALLTAYADALAGGLSVADALAAVGRSGALVESDGAGLIVPMEPDGTAADDPVESDGTAAETLQHLRLRLAALRDALELGAPLSTAETALLLGARPGGGEVVRGRIRAVRLRRNLWTLEPD